MTTEARRQTDTVAVERRSETRAAATGHSQTHYCVVTALQATNRTTNGNAYPRYKAITYISTQAA